MLDIFGSDLLAGVSSLAIEPVTVVVIPVVVFATGFITLVAVPIIAIGSVVLISKFFNSRNGGEKPTDAQAWDITERARNLGGKPREKDLY